MRRKIRGKCAGAMLAVALAYPTAAWAFNCGFGQNTENCFDDTGGTACQVAWEVQNFCTDNGGSALATARGVNRGRVDAALQIVRGFNAIRADSFGVDANGNTVRSCHAESDSRATPPDPREVVIRQGCQNAVEHDVFGRS